MSDTPVSASALVETIFPTVREYATLVAKLPQGADYEFQCAFLGFPREMRRHNAALVDLIDACTQHVPRRRRAALSAAITGTAAAAATTTAAAAAGPVVAGRHAATLELIDSLLENVDVLLDAARGMRQDDEAVAFGSALLPAGGSGGEGHAAPSLLPSVIVRPQLTFEEPVDNSDAPFRPLLVGPDGEKPTARGEPGVHPFRARLAEAQLRYPDWLLRPRPDVLFRPLAECPLTFVDSPAALAAMVATLKGEKEVAIDLEHHDLHSYQGFTCLMQISTRTEDYIVDCLRLRSAMHALAPVLLDASIVKVLHGAAEDVKWLQKDFGLFIVNLFDTGLALQALHMPHGLAFAVDHFCQVRLDKRHQTSDWRVRPLPADMVAYARQDTHYLLYVFDRLHALLLNNEQQQQQRNGGGGAAANSTNMLMHVLNEGRQLCLTLYEKPQHDAQRSFRDALGRSIGGLGPMQLAVARAVYNWRDAAARDADESPVAVMPAAAILRIALRPPQTVAALLKAASPVSVVLRSGAASLLAAVVAAVAESGDAAAAASLAAAGGSGANDDEGATSEWAGRAHVHTPLTGTLPSVALPPGTVVDLTRQAAVPALPQCRVVAAKESPWFALMSRLKELNAATPAPSSIVLLPGHDVKRVTVAASAVPAAVEAATAAGEDEAEAVVAADEAEGVQTAATAGNDAAAAAPPAAAAAADAQPVSLLEKFGALGRKTRRDEMKKRGRD